MNILLFGRGVVATLYGWALERAGHTVDFYVRPGRAAQTGSTVHVNFYDLRPQPEPAQHVEQAWPIHLRETLPADHAYDLILVSVAHYRLPEAITFLSTRVSQATILLFGNFWDDPQAAALLPPDQLVWGFPGAGGGFQPSGELYGALFPTVEIGTSGTAPPARVVRVEQLFRDAGFTVQEHQNFREWLWVHFAVSAAITAQQLLTGLARRAIYENHDQALEQAVRMVRELMPVLAARGVVVEQHAELTFFNQPERDVVQALGQLVQNPAFQVAVDGHAQPEELRRMFQDVLAESRRLGVLTPLFEAAARFLP